MYIKEKKTKPLIHNKLCSSRMNTRCKRWCSVFSTFVSKLVSPNSPHICVSVCLFIGLCLHMKAKWKSKSKIMLDFLFSKMMAFTFQNFLLSFFQVCFWCFQRTAACYFKWKFLGCVWNIPICSNFSSKIALKPKFFQT